MLATGKTYRAKKGGALGPGPYTVLAAHARAQASKMRVGVAVRIVVPVSPHVRHRMEESRKESVAPENVWDKGTGRCQDPVKSI